MQSPGMLLNQTDEFHARLRFKTAEQKLGNNGLKILTAAMPNSSTAQALKLVKIFWGIVFVCFYLFCFSIWAVILVICCILELHLCILELKYVIYRKIGKLKSQIWMVFATFLVFTHVSIDFNDVWIVFIDFLMVFNDFVHGFNFFQVFGPFSRWCFLISSIVKSIFWCSSISRWLCAEGLRVQCVHLSNYKHMYICMHYLNNIYIYIYTIYQ